MIKMVYQINNCTKTQLSLFHFLADNLRLAEQRKRPASPNSDYMVLIDEVVVDPIDGTPDEYDVTLHPFNCGNDFGLMELTNKEVI